MQLNSRNTNSRKPIGYISKHYLTKGLIAASLAAIFAFGINYGAKLINFNPKQQKPHTIINEVQEPIAPETTPIIQDENDSSAKGTEPSNETPVIQDENNSSAEETEPNIITPTDPTKEDDTSDKGTSSEDENNNSEEEEQPDIEENVVIPDINVPGEGIAKVDDVVENQ